MSLFWNWQRQGCHAELLIYAGGKCKSGGGVCEYVEVNKHTF